MNWKKYLLPSKAGSRLFKKHLKKEYDYQPPSFTGSVRRLFKAGIVDLDTPSSGLKNLTDDGDERLEKTIVGIESVIRKSGSDIMGFVSGSLDEIHLCLSEDREAGFGCSCGIYGTKPHEGGHVIVMTTADHIIGAAEGIVHELGHHRLHALDIQLLTSPDELIGNDDADLFDSPVRFDIQRPMAACVHAQYSYTVVTQFYSGLMEHMVKKDLDELTGSSLKDIAARQAYNVKRIGNGIHMMRDHFEAGTDPEFRDVLMAYFTDQYIRARDILKALDFDTDWQPKAGDI